MPRRDTLDSRSIIFSPTDENSFFYPNKFYIGYLVRLLKFGMEATVTRIVAGASQNGFPVSIANGSVLKVIVTKRYIHVKSNYYSSTCLPYRYIGRSTVC